MTIRRDVLTTRKREDFDSVVLSLFRYTPFELCYIVVFIVQAIVKVDHKDKVKILIIEPQYLLKSKPFQIESEPT